MLVKKGLVCGLATIVGVFFAFDSRAEVSSQVLFKLHDIKPLTDSDGLVNGCEYSTTFYNRTGTDIASAQVNLTWKDDVVVKNNEQVKKKETRSSRRGRSSKSVVEDTGSVLGSITLPPLKNDRQITLKNKVNTDKCFLLLGEVETDIVSCSFAGKTGVDKGCINMFRFVTPDEQQYYVEFKTVLAEEAVEQEKSKYEQSVSEMDNMYNKAVSSIQKISSSLLTTAK